MQGGNRTSGNGGHSFLPWGGLSMIQMIRRLMLAAALVLPLVFVPQHAQLAIARTVASTSLAMFDAEAAAQAHCPRDVVV